ncbi:phenylacetaldoxime dehydratase family protein [Mesorhizobium sp. M8A.F.Ca.ET.173.01.1.1]|nr:phenylacetaldoxime dehydratase family protein [Mesorhizobium sp. M8A.F.Ca.ET.173.01.1.1]
MESAIGKHLQCPRTRSRRVADDYQPPYPSWVARAGKDLQQVVMGYFGVQYKGDEHRAAALCTLRHIVAEFGLVDGPGKYDLTHHQDAQGYDNLIAVGYWRDPEAHERWRLLPEVAGWWGSNDRLAADVGVFREIVSPRAEQFETIYGYNEQFPGVGAIMDGTSGEIQEHGYWGSMRDRFPISQTEWIGASGTLAASSDPARGGRVVIRGHDGITLIRSGQDWAKTEGKERDLYLNEIEPVLRKGMDFLRDNGKSTGCYSNRYVYNIDIDDNRIETSYNIGHWRSLDLLERWAESHPTHLRIFAIYMVVAHELSKLQLYHEVSVFEAGSQFYEYVNCHPETGMLRDAAAPRG